MDKKKAHCKKKHRYCCFFGCKNSCGNVKGIQFHRFPKEERRCRKWVQASQNKALINIPAAKLNRSYVVCDDHFSNWCYLNQALKGRLVHDAVPDHTKPPLTKVQTLYFGPLPDKYCRFKGCKNTSNNVEINLFEFPKEELRCHTWIEACQNKSLNGVPAADLHRTAHVCQEHFLDWCFTDINNKHTLVQNAIPNCAKFQVTDNLDLRETAAINDLNSSFSSTSSNHSSVNKELFISPTSICKPSTVSESAVVKELNSPFSSTSNSCVIGELLLAPPSVYETSTVTEFDSAKVTNTSSSVLVNAPIPKATSSSIPGISQTKTYILLTPTLLYSDETFPLNAVHSDPSADISSFSEETLIYPVSAEELNAICEPEQSVTGASCDSSLVDIPIIAETNYSSTKHYPAKKLSPTKSRLIEKVKKYRALLKNLELKLAAYEKNNSEAKS